MALSQCKPKVEDAFLAGINHVFYHGIPYSPPSETWPGWLFYASVHFGPTNTFWDHLSPMNQYITRCQSILQSGSADNEVLVIPACAFMPLATLEKILDMAGEGSLLVFESLPSEVPGRGSENARW